MVYCSHCGHQIHETAPTCPKCGGVQHPTATNTSAMQHELSRPDKKFHITMIIAASFAVLLLYTTLAFPFIAIGTGMVWGLSIRLFRSHKINPFNGTKILDWILLVVFSTGACICQLAGIYVVQGPLMIFVAVRSLVMYLKIYSSASSAIQVNRN